MFGKSINQFSILILAEPPLWLLWCMWGATTKLHSWATMILKHRTVSRCHLRGKAHISDSVATSNLILNCLVFLKRKKVILLGVKTEYSGRRVPVPLKWGWRGGGGQRASRLELCMTDLPLNLTVYVSPTVPRHRSYSQLLSKQDAWGVNMNWLAPNCLLPHQTFHRPELSFVSQVDISPHKTGYRQKMYFL